MNRQVERQPSALVDVTRIWRVALIALAIWGVLAPEASFALPWQASVTPSVELAVRHPGAAPFDAVFALTSPGGETRRARVHAPAGEFASVVFGTASASGPFGVLDARFSPSEPGHWIWTCSVDGETVAHGAFVLARNADGTASIRTDPPNFNH